MRRMRWVGHLASMGEEVAQRIVVRKPVGKTPLERPRRGCVDNIRIYLLEAGYVYVYWIGLAQD